MDPDEAVQRAIGLVFERFRLEGSAYGVVRYFKRHGLRLPAREVPGEEIDWVVAHESRVLRILHHPIFAGAYVYGRTEERMGLCGGELRRRVV